ncbi:hypothetical protein [Streptomyces sp. NBC_01594]|uniref:hypothetical protein n=1 Tax=Streptomyces sp. NBC_01594 TaxID=2975890 RepID=UPI00386C48D3
MITLEELRDRIPALRAHRISLNRQLEALAAELVDRQSCLRLAENLEGFLTRLRHSAQTTSTTSKLWRDLRPDLTETPRARTRTSHFAALRPTDQKIDGAKPQGPN